jgi:uroporphyrinogen-III synthase
MSEAPAPPPSDDVPRVVLLRSPDRAGEDRYVRALAERGFRATCRPVLRFAFAGDPGFAGGDVAARLRRPEQYAGLVCTSPRAARAVAAALGQQRDARQSAWQEKLAFAVGPKTAKALRESGLSPTGEDAGDAAALAEQIVQAEGNASAHPLLFLCGNRRREALPRRLRAEGVAFEECVAYETHQRDGPWLGAVDGDAPEWAVFFSPSGVEAVRRAQEPGGEAVRKAALGPTTAGALREVGWPPEAVAASPTPAALAEAVAACQSA